MVDAAPASFADLSSDERPRAHLQARSGNGGRKARRRRPGTHTSRATPSTRSASHPRYERRQRAGTGQNGPPQNRRACPRQGLSGRNP